MLKAVIGGFMVITLTTLSFVAIWFFRNNISAPNNNDSSLVTNTTILNTENIQSNELAQNNKTENKYIFVTYKSPAKHSDLLIETFVTALKNSGASLLTKNDLSTRFEFETKYGQVDLSYQYAHGDPCENDTCEGYPTFSIKAPVDFIFSNVPELPGYTIDTIKGLD